jgi:pyridoxal 5'-phosphate synthase pdxT subunit
VRIGVLALQGAFREHRRVLEGLGVETIEVRRPSDLVGLDGLVIPGGESTTIRMLMDEYALTGPLRDRIADGFPVLGTCAGMIVLSRRVDGASVPGLDALDVDVRRNAFGRQVDSFETDLDVPALGDRPFHAVFIRAPLVDTVGTDVNVLARLEDDTVVGVQSGSVIGVAFHPELTDDARLHRYFVQLVAAGEPLSSSRK